LLLFGVLATCLAAGQALQIGIAAHDKRCVGEEMAEDAMARLIYFVVPTNAENAKLGDVEVSITAPNRKRLVVRDLSSNVDEFTFTSHEVGMHQICFKNKVKQPRRVHLEVHTNLVKDYTEMVQKEHLKPVEVQFRKAEDMLKAISNEMGKSREREAQLRETSEAMASRIQMFSIASITVLLAMSAWQVYYLKSFFRSKKLL